MNYDFLIIGGGSAGYAAARTAAGLGLKTAVVEGGRDVGGLCILRGCMPSKALIESANRYRTLREAGEFGLRAGDIGFDGEEIIARKRRLIREFAEDRRKQLATGRFDFFRGQARFTDAHTIEVDLLEGGQKTLTARSFLLATGSVISTPPLPGLSEISALTSDDLLDEPNLPESLIVLGAGPVALEMAYYVHALGRAVTVLQRNTQLLTGVDPDAANAVEQAFRRRGLEIFTGTKILGMTRTGGRVRITFEHEGEKKTVEAADVLNALGRKPNTGSLGLGQADVTLDHGRVVAEPTQQTSQPHIFAAGDCTGPYEIVHIAIQQGEIAARNAARLLKGEDASEKIDYRLNLYAVFTEPQVAAVGLSETEARAKNIPYRAASYPFNDHGKSMIMHELDGFVKLLADPESGEILGGCVVGPHASDLIHEVVVAMHFRSTAAQFATIPHYHPTLSEIWTYPAEELM